MNPAPKWNPLSRCSRVFPLCIQGTRIVNKLNPYALPSWFRALKDEMKKSSFEKLSTFVKQKRKEGTVYPSPENVFSWTKRPLNEIKVSSIRTYRILGRFRNPGENENISKPSYEALNLFSDRT